MFDDEGILSLVLLVLCLCGLIPALYLLNSSFASMFVLGFLLLVLAGLIIIIIIARR